MAAAAAAAAAEGRKKNRGTDEDEDDSAFWGSLDTIGDMKNSPQPFEVRPFSSGSAVEEMFNFTKSEASFTQDESSSSPSSLFVHGNGSKSNSPSMEIMNTRAATTNSVTSAITELSQTDGSGSTSTMMLPFPFHGRPGLPHVDDFVPKCKLSYDHLRMMNNLEKKALILMKQIKAPKTMRIHEHDIEKVDIGSSSNASSSRLEYDSSMGDKIGSIDDEENSSNNDDHTSNTSRHSLSVRQIRFFLKYIQFFGEVDYKSNKYRGITYMDIETGLRMHARSMHAPHSGGGIEDTNDMLMAMFDDLLIQSKLKPTQWFQLHSMEVAGNERKLTKEMFTSNVRSMCREHNLPTWSDLEMRQLRLHLSLDGQTEPTLNGVLRAFRRYHAMAEEKEINEAAQPIIEKILRLMRKRKIRIIDFFTYLGEDPADPVPVKQLIFSIRSVLGSKTAVLIRSPPRNLHALPMSPDGVYVPSMVSEHSQSQSSSKSGSMLSKQTSPSPSRNNSNSNILSLLSSKITRDVQLSSIVGLGPKKSGTEAVMRDAIPEDLAILLQQQYVKAQKNLYSNGMFYTNKQGKASLDKLTMANISNFDSLQNNQNRKVGSFLKGNPRGKRASQSGTLSNSLSNTTGSGGGSSSPLGSPSPPTPPLPEKLITPPTWTSLTLSPTFIELAESRTVDLIQSHSSYDQKRRHHRRELASFF